MEFIRGMKEDDYSRMIEGLIAMGIIFIVCLVLGVVFYEVMPIKEFCDQNGGEYTFTLELEHTCNGTKIIKLDSGEYIFKPNFSAIWDLD